MSDAGHESRTIARRVRSAVLWRSGSQLAGQLVMWASTFLVLRLLHPADYGLFAMTEVVIAFAGLMNGYSFAGALVQADEIDAKRVAQVFGALLLMNFSLAAIQFIGRRSPRPTFTSRGVAAMLRVQCLLHLMTPFIIMPQALLARQIDFRAQGRINFTAAALAAATAPACAYAGLGVWTLVIAPLVLFGARALGLAIVGRWLIRPRFDFSGAAATFGFGGAVLVSEILWFAQSQADVFIAGRRLEPRALGLYTTALFLAQILVNKFVPALNDVAFPAYARMQADRAAIAAGFVRSVRLIMIAAMPFSFGLAAAADPIVRTMMGPQWLETVPVVQILALAMPAVTLHILYHPATNALGRPAISAWVSAAGAVIMPLAFLAGVGGGARGMAWSWLAGFPLLLAVSTMLSAPVIGVRIRDLAAAVAPPLVAAAAMAAAVIALGAMLPPLAPAGRLAILVPAGAILYVAALLIVARGALAELIALARGRAPRVT